MLASTNLEDLTTFMRPKRGPLEQGFTVQHCPEVLVAGDEFERYGEQSVYPINPALCIVLGGRDKAATSSIRFRLQCTFLPSVLDLSRADAKFFHEAGFDAYVTGFCFIMTAHLTATVNYL